MLFFTQYDHPRTKGNAFGSRYEPKFQEYVNSDGHLTVELSSYTDRYAKIQESAESCKIENILKAVAMGDLSALKSQDLTYGDATTMPKSLMEAQNLVIRMKNEFNNLPYEVRKEFNNSAEMYVHLMGTEEFNNIMTPYNKKVADIAAAGSAKEYNKKVSEAAKFNKDVQKAMEVNNES